MQSANKTNLGEIVIAGLGLWFSVRAVTQLSGAFGVFEEILSGAVPFAYFLPFVLSGLCGLFLLIFRRRLAVELFGSAVREDDGAREESSDLRPFLVSLLGLWFIASGLVDAASTEANSLLYPAAELTESLFEGGPSRALITSEAWLSRVPYVVQLVVGLVLFASSGRIAELWVRMRAAGRLR